MFLALARTRKTREYLWAPRLGLSAVILWCCGATVSADTGMVLRVAPASEPPAIDLSEILDDPKETRERLGWVAALRVGTAAGMHYMNSQSIKSQCSGSLCGALGMNAIEGIQLGLQDAQTINAMTEVFQTTISESSAAGSTADAQVLADALQSKAGDATIQTELATLTERFVASATAFTVAQGAGAEGTPNAPPAGLEPTHALEVRLDEIRTDGNFVNSGLAIELVGTAKLVDLATGETVQAYTQVQRTPSYRQADWSVAGAGVMAQEMVVAMARLTEVLTEETLLVVNSPSGKGKGYLMQPVDPKSGICLMGCRGKMWGNFGFGSEVASLTPTLSWESFESRYAEDPLDPEHPALDAVTYDLRLFEAVPITRIMGDKIYGAGPMLAEYRDIETNELTLDEPLPGCKRLVWTVRARFDANGQRHLSRWSGHYNEKKVDRMRKAEVDDEGKFNDGLSAVFSGGDYSTQRQESAWFYAFRTPPPEGQKRCKW